MLKMFNTSRTALGSGSLGHSSVSRPVLSRMALSFASVALATLGSLLMPSRASAQASFPSITWNKVIYVAPWGSSSNSGSYDSPKDTLQHAYWGARDAYNPPPQNSTTPSNYDLNVKIVLRNGTYTNVGGRVQMYELDADGLTNSGAQKYFCIEGESAGGVILDGTNFSNTNYAFLDKNGGKNIMVRNLTFKNFKVYPMQFGDSFTILDMDNWLIENCNFQGNEQPARIMCATRRVTVRNCKFNDNLREGFIIAIKNSLIENCEFNGNWKNNTYTSTYNSGGMSFQGRNVQIKNCTFNNNFENGFRQDHVSEYVTVTDCQFINNRYSGILMETAYGPTTFERCQIRENRAETANSKNVGGVDLETAFDVTFKNCDIVDNSKQAFKVVLKARPINPNGCTGTCELGAGDMELSYGQTFDNKKSMGDPTNPNDPNKPYVKNTRILGCRIVSKDAATSTGQGYLIGRNPNDGYYDLYDDWYIDQFTGAGNTYWNRAGSTNVFEKLGGNAESDRLFTDFTNWKTLTGSEGAATIDGVSYGASQWKNPNLLSNPGFEAEQYGTQTPSGWSEWSGTSINCGYTEWGGRTGVYRGVHYNSGAYNMYTLQSKSSLPSGLYTFRAWVKSSGGQKSLSLWAKQFNASNTAETKSTNITTSAISNWTLYEVRDINVTSGQCEVGIWSDANSGNWLQFDDCEFIKQW